MVLGRAVPVSVRSTRFTDPSSLLRLACAVLLQPYFLQWAGLSGPVESADGFAFAWSW